MENLITHFAGLRRGLSILSLRVAGEREWRKSTNIVTGFKRKKNSELGNFFMTVFLTSFFGSCSQGHMTSHIRERIVFAHIIGNANAFGNNFHSSSNHFIPLFPLFCFFLDCFRYIKENWS